MGRFCWSVGSSIGQLDCAPALVFNNSVCLGECFLASTNVCSHGWLSWTFCYIQQMAWGFILISQLFGNNITDYVLVMVILKILSRTRCMKAKFNKRNLKWIFLKLLLVPRLIFYRDHYPLPIIYLSSCIFKD